MIKVTKFNEEVFIINCAQIEIIESIPESKITLQNKTFFIVKESPDEIIQKVIDFYSMIESLHRHTLEVR